MGQGLLPFLSGKIILKEAIAVREKCFHGSMSLVCNVATHPRLDKGLQQSVDILLLL